MAKMMRVANHIVFKTTLVFEDVTVKCFLVGKIRLFK